MAQRVRVTCTGLIYGQTCQNVLHFTNLNDVFNGALIAAEINANWIEYIKALQTSHFTWTNILVQNLDNAATPTFSLVISKQGGGLNEPRVPPFAALVLKISTTLGGRRGRGRVYIGGMVSLAFELGVFTSSFMTQIATQTANIKSRYGPTGASELRLGVMRRDTGEISPLVDIQGRGTLGVQRRRNIGVGV